MSQCAIENLTLLERGIIVRGLVESGQLLIIDADAKVIWNSHDIADVSKQGDKIQIVVSKR